MEDTPKVRTVCGDGCFLPLCQTCSFPGSGSLSLSVVCPSSCSDSLHFRSLRNALLFLAQWQGPLFSVAGSTSLSTHLSQVHWICVLDTGTDRGARHEDTQSHVAGCVQGWRGQGGRSDSLGESDAGSSSNRRVGLQRMNKSLAGGSVEARRGRRSLSVPLEPRTVLCLLWCYCVWPSQHLH